MADNISTITLPSGDTYDIKDAVARSRVTFYGTCSTAAATAAKIVTVPDDNFALEAGVIIGVKYSASNTASNVTLNVNSTGAKSIWYNNAVYTSNSNSICGYANRHTFYMYDGTYWVYISNSVTDSNTYTSAYCSTGAATAAKTASCSGYILKENSYLHIIMTNSNTYAGAITLNVNSKGAKPIYINGAASSASNYTLPASSYLIYYDGTNYYFQTDGLIPGKIQDQIDELKKSVSDGKSAVASAITEKGVSTASDATFDTMATNILSIEPNLQSKSVTPSEIAQTVTADSDYDGLSQVSVGAISSTYVGSDIARHSSSDLTASGATVTAPAGYYSTSASKSVSTATQATPSVSIDNSTGLITATATQTAGYVSAGTKTGTLQLGTQGAQTITPSTSAQTIGAGVYLTGDQTIAAMPTGTAGTPTASKGTVSNHSISVTPSVTNTTGYITGGTKTGTAVTVSASELVSGTKTITDNGTGIDVANYATVDVDLDFIAYYTGEGTPASSLGEDGDIYLDTTGTSGPVITQNATTKVVSIS